MSNQNEKLTLEDVNPQLTVEAMRNLKKALATLFPEEQREKALESLGSLKNRDLIFYSLGKAVGIQAAEDAICSHLGSGKAEQSDAI